MGKSSPTKMQLKHIPDLVVLQTVFAIQNLWRASRHYNTVERDGNLYYTHEWKLSFIPNRTAHLDEIHEQFKVIPKKLLWRKLQQLEDRRLLIGHGPSGLHYHTNPNDWPEA